MEALQVLDSSVPSVDLDLLNSELVEVTAALVAVMNKYLDQDLSLVWF